MPQTDRTVTPPAAKSANATQREQRKAQRREEIKGLVRGRGHVDHGDLRELRRDHGDDELTTLLAEHYATPEGKAEAARAGKGGMDPLALARLVVGGR